MSTKEAEQHPTPEEISARAYEIYLSSWEESLSVEHWIAAEKELIEEYAQRESARPEGNRMSIPSSPWRNHVFLSDEICIGDSGELDDGRVVTMKKKSLVDAQAPESEQAAKEAQKQTRTVDFSVLVGYQIPTGCGRLSSD